VSKVEIIPPQRTNLPARPTGTTVVSVPRANPGGVVSSTLTRWQANGQTRALTALRALTVAEANLYDAQSQAMESYVTRERAAARLAELPEIIATDRARRRAERAGELRTLQHQFEIAELRRKTECTQAHVTLEDARQALRAQREHGYAAYELEWHRRQCEILELELTAEEQREILREHRAKQSDHGAAAEPDTSSDEVYNALFDARSQMRASGLDTSKIDALLRERQQRK
jgi:hypothetical protein